MSESSVNITEQALSIAASVAFCSAPPWGPVLGAGALTISALLSDFFPSTSPNAPTLQQIVAAVSQQFSQHDIQGAMNQITAVQNEFIALTSGTGANRPLPKSLNATLKNDPDGTFSNLYNFLNKEVSGVGTLVPAIGSMATETQGDICRVDGDLQAAYLPAFAYGVSTYLLLATYWASLVTAVEPSAVTDTSLYVGVNYLASTTVANQTGWINYFNNVCEAYEHAVKGRLAQVNNDPGVGCVPYTYFGGIFNPVELDGVYFSDNGESVDNFHPEVLNFVARYYPQSAGNSVRDVYFPGDLGNISLPPGATNVAFALAEGRDGTADQRSFVASCNNMRDQYIDLMQQTLYANYVDPSRLQAVAGPWQKSLGMLQSALGLHGFG